jgi:hypothetical protein
MATVARFLIGAKEVIFDCSALGIFAIISLWVPSANATDVDAAIVFAVDASDSVDPATADLQREGHAEAICSPEVIAAIARNRVGCIAITYFEWASRGNKRTLLPWTTVCGISDARAAAASILRNGGGDDGCRGRCGTSISFAIDLGSLLLDGFAVNASNRIIDVSANGTSNDGLPVQLSRQRAIGKGYSINAIAIPPIMRGLKHDLTSYFAQNVIGGPNAFVIVPAAKRDYAVALRRKLVVEIGMSAKPPIARRRG